MMTSSGVLAVERALSPGRRHAANTRKYRTTLCGLPWSTVAEGDDLDINCAECRRHLEPDTLEVVDSARHLDQEGTT